MDYKIIDSTKYKDKRGSLIIYLKSSELIRSHKKFGQIYYVTFNKKGIIRGNHYHKNLREWLGIVQGRVLVLLEDVITKKRVEILLNSRLNNYQRLEIGPNIAHAIESLSPKSVLLNYCDKEWSPKDSHQYKIR